MNSDRTKRSVCCPRFGNNIHTHDDIAGDEFKSVYESKFGPVDYVYGISSASTDFVSLNNEALKRTQR